MTLKDYPISFPYNSADAPYSLLHRHRGADRACPIGTPIVIGSTTIGLTGNSGQSSGPHCHIQAWVNEPSNTRNPAPYEFKPGEVVQAGVSSDFGNYITIDVGGVNVSYCHLSQINVKVGQVIGDDMVQDQDVRNLWPKMFAGAAAKDSDIKAWSGNSFKDFFYGVAGGPEFAAQQADFVSWKKTGLVLSQDAVELKQGHYFIKK